MCCRQLLGVDDNAVIMARLGAGLSGVHSSFAWVLPFGSMP